MNEYNGKKKHNYAFKVSLKFLHTRSFSFWNELQNGREIQAQLSSRVQTGLIPVTNCYLENFFQQTQVKECCCLKRYNMCNFEVIQLLEYDFTLLLVVLVLFHIPVYGFSIMVKDCKHCITVNRVHSLYQQNDIASFQHTDRDVVLKQIL